jgi:tetratricopeptide (TPR) repeat protein
VAGESFEALRAAAATAQSRSEYRKLERIALQLLALGDSGGKKPALAWGHHFLGVARLRLNDGIAAKRELLAAVELFDQLGDAVAASRSTMNLAVIELALNVDVLAARRYFDAAMPAVRRSGDALRIARALGNLGEIYRLEGEYRAALRAAGESLEMFRRLGDHARAAWQLTNAAHLHSLLRSYPEAMESLKLAYDELVQEPVQKWIAWYFDVCFIIAAKLNRWDIAAQLQGFADRLRDEHAIPRSQVMMPWLSEPKERLATVFSGERHEELLQQGEGLTLEQAEALVVTMNDD